MGARWREMRLRHHPGQGPLEGPLAVSVMVCSSLEWGDPLLLGISGGLIPCLRTPGWVWGNQGRSLQVSVGNYCYNQQLPTIY